MALIRASWLWGPLLACALVAVALLPPQLSGGRPGRPSWVDMAGVQVYTDDRPPSPYRNDVSEALRVQEAAARNAALAESILTVARGPRALRSADGAVWLVFEAPLTADSARFWLDAVTRELALYPAAGRGMPLVVALFSAPARAREKAATYWSARELVERGGSGSACVVTVNMFGTAEWLQAGTYVAHDAARRAVTRWLSVCGLYARFGSPGPIIKRWAAGNGRRFWYRWYPLTSQLVDARRAVRRREIQPMLGETDLPWWAERWLEAGCLRGAPQACLRATGLDAAGLAPYSAWSTVPPERVLAFLLATGAPEQFAAFWRSSLRPEAALAGAYRAPAAGLVRDALLHWYRVPPSGGPRVDARGALAGVGWAALAVLLALLAGRRWRAAV